MNNETMNAKNDLVLGAINFGAAQERERILKLLESQLGAYYSEPVTMDDGLKAAIALVREVTD